MLLFLIRRLGGLVATILVATMVVFVVLELLPGDPASLMLGVNAQPDTIAALRAELGLDEPSFLRYLHWIVVPRSFDFRDWAIEVFRIAGNVETFHKVFVVV